jgi:hypothetical protein
MMDILDSFQKLVSTDREILTSIGLDCRDPQAYYFLLKWAYLSRWPRVWQQIPRKTSFSDFLTEKDETGVESPEIHTLSSSSLLLCFSVVVESAVFKS